MHPIAKTSSLVLLVVLGCLIITYKATSQQTDYSQLKSQAEQQYSSGSYQNAHEIYSRINLEPLSAAEKRWVQFRLADTLWRSQAATQTADMSKYEKAQKELEEIIRDKNQEDERDFIWAEAHESLGDFFWTRSNQINWGGAWPHYQQALEWWAGQRDINQARDRYLKIVFKADYPARQNQYYYYSYYGNTVPLNILENALKISQKEDDKAHLHYLIAMTMRHHGGDWEMRQRVADEFEAALAGGRKTEWHDDALYHYAEWMNQTGTIKQNEKGEWTQQPDYVKALELFRRLTREYAKGETRYYDQALSQINTITEPQLGIYVSNIFLPDSELQFVLNARNVKRVNYALYKVNLTRDVRFTKNPSDEEGEGQDGSVDWIRAIQLAGRPAVKSWSEELQIRNQHEAINKETRIEGKLPVGAYLLEAKAGSQTVRDVLLVTDTAILLKTSGKQALVYYSHAVTGAPISNASVSLWESYYQRDNKWRWRRLTKLTNNDGLAVFDLRGLDSHRNLFIAAENNERQSFSTGYSYQHHQPGDAWRIYAYTDRPAYRPKETVQWKFVARRFANGEYSTPANQSIEYQITDARGTKVTEGKATLNAFGSAWGSIELTDQNVLGEYNIQFWNDGKTQNIGGARLFRVEEFKLPEFKVAVKTPEENGKKKAFRLGEQVSVDISADYYFGGSVANASVEVVVYQNPFYHFWFPRRDYPWYYDDVERQRGYYYGGQGQIIKRETLKTDSTGKATLTFDTPRENSNQDLEYRIEARVTDSSRREIVATDTVRVTRQRYYVHARPKQNIYKPQDKVTIEINAVDANSQPISTEGQVKVTRDYWYEIWLDPSGREVKGEELRLLRQKGTFPPIVKPNQQGWRLKFRGYQHDDITTAKLKTDAEGKAEFSFIAPREGYYRLEWLSSQVTAAKRDKFLPLIKTQASVFVATNASSDLGYRTSGVEIIVDKDTVRAGQVAPVMLSVPNNDRYVLFTVEGEDLYSYQLIHVTGNAKLIALPIEQKYVPNIYLNAAMVSDLQLSVDTKHVVVPPTDRFINVEMKTDREQYQPREEGTVSIRTKDANGKPVATEVGLSLMDDSVNYIQRDYAGDPRQFYYGTKRRQLIHTNSTFAHKAFAKLVDDGKGLVTEDFSRKDDDRVGMKEERRYAYIAKDGVAEFGAGRLAQRDITSLPISGRTENLALLRPGAVANEAEAPPPPKSPTDEPAVQVRSDFRSTALWLPDLKTDPDGFASVKVKFPDSLTTWQATARVASTGNQFGIGNASARTKQPLIVRLQAPRFFVVGDQVTVSAVINNNTDQPMRVTPSLNAQGVTVAGQAVAGQIVSDPPPVDVKPNSEARVDWRVTVTHASEAKLKVQGRGGSYADAMEKTFTIYEHGIEKFLSRSGKMRSDSVAVSLDIPKERKADSTTLTVQVAPSMATTMLDALPYLIDYPYGCTEQTMSRFLPAAITAKTLRDLGMKPETAMHKIFGGIEAETAAATHPKGKHDLSELNDITRQSLERLYDFQHSDGGWGWWKDGESDHFMTAYVVWGMTLAQQAGIQVRSDALARGAQYLDKELVEEELHYDAQAWMLHALATYHASQKKMEATAFQNKAVDNLWTNRDKLNAYTRALFALAVHHFGYADKAKTLVQNLANGVKIDSRPDISIVQRGANASDPSVIGTAHWGEDGIFWRWSEGGVEATSFALRALLAIDPQNKLIEPVTNWLIKNRRGAQWSNTRDTAIVVMTLNDYLRTTGEVQTQLGYELIVNGKTIATKQLTAEDALSAPSKFAVPRELIKDGSNEIVVRRTSGNGAIYFAAEAKFFSLEEPLKAAGNEIFVRRQYFRLVNHPTLLKGFVSERVPLKDGETVKSGDRVEAVITIEAKNNYEYLLFEDLKPAGLEAVQIRSGEHLFVKELKSAALNNSQKSTLMNYTSNVDFTGRTRWVYQELRDRKVALFIDKLPEGVWQLRYELRAEAPGTFHALPVLGHAMYVPEIRTNGEEVRMNVVD